MNSDNARITVGDLESIRRTLSPQDFRNLYMNEWRPPENYDIEDFDRRCLIALCAALEIPDHLFGSTLEHDDDPGAEEEG